MILNGKIININESPFFINSVSLDFNDLLSFWMHNLWLVSIILLLITCFGDTIAW